MIVMHRLAFYLWWSRTRNVNEKKRRIEIAKLRILSVKVYLQKKLQEKLRDIDETVQLRLRSFSGM